MVNFFLHTVAPRMYYHHTLCSRSTQVEWPRAVLHYVLKIQLCFSGSPKSDASSAARFQVCYNQMSSLVVSLFLLLQDSKFARESDFDCIPPATRLQVCQKKISTGFLVNKTVCQNPILPLFLLLQYNTLCLLESDSQAPRLQVCHNQS